MADRVLLLLLCRFRKSGSGTFSQPCSFLLFYEVHSYDCSLARTSTENKDNRGQGTVGSRLDPTFGCVEPSSSSFFFSKLKGRTLEEINELIERSLSVWKFKTTKVNIDMVATQQMFGGLFSPNPGAPVFKTRCSCTCSLIVFVSPSPSSVQGHGG